jgi:hypothetical protein
VLTQLARHGFTFSVINALTRRRHHVHLRAHSPHVPEADSGSHDISRLARRQTTRPAGVPRRPIQAQIDSGSLFTSTITATVVGDKRPEKFA